jgi:hypothetical protein
VEQWKKPFAKKNPKRGKNRDLTRVLSMEGMADIS